VSERSDTCCRRRPGLPPFQIDWWQCKPEPCAVHRLRHEARGLAVDLRDLMDAVLINLQLVGHHGQRRELHAEFVLGGSDFVVVLLDLTFMRAMGGEHFGRISCTESCAAPGSSPSWSTRGGEIARSYSCRHWSGFHRVELEPGVVRRALIPHVVETKKFGFGSEIDRVADAHGLDHASARLGDAAGSRL